MKTKVLTMNFMVFKAAAIGVLLISALASQI